MKPVEKFCYILHKNQHSVDLFAVIKASGSASSDCSDNHKSLQSFVTSDTFWLNVTDILICSVFESEPEIFNLNTDLQHQPYFITLIFRY